MTKNRISTDPTTAPQVREPLDRMTFVIVPRFNMATLITMIEPLRVANYLAPVPLYH